NEIVKRCVVHPARIFGLKNKGALEVGKDADIVLVNPDVEYKLTDEQMLSKCGWTPFAGWNIKGRVEQVFLRGSLAYDRGICVVRPSSGKPVVIEA
ncbi:MAG TPA: amidohydrolase family protein, partial [Ktedonobacteraceae bacterium]|nr:amidohydrolase family protein [Ktedonobacteraceae bacterium]